MLGHNEGVLHGVFPEKQISWWRYQIKSFLLALCCEENPPVTGEYPSQWRSTSRCFPWKADFLMTLLNEIIFRVTGPLRGGIHPTGEFPSQKPMKRSFDVFFDMHLNNREAGDFKRHHTHYDVIVMWPKYATILIAGVACICAFELFEGKRSYIKHCCLLWIKLWRFVSLAIQVFVHKLILVDSKEFVITGQYDRSLCTQSESLNIYAYALILNI